MRRLSLLVGLVACAPKASDPPTPVEREPPPTVDAPAAAERDLHAEPIASGWGSVGVAPAGPIPYWVIGTVTVTADSDLTGVRLGALDVLDAEGNVLGQADRELELRRAGPSSTDFSRHGTAAFDGTLAAGRPIHLRFGGRMEDAFADRLETSPHTYRLTLVDDTGAIAHITAPLGSQWPTG